jgi:hypothetical protein
MNPDSWFESGPLLTGYLPGYGNPEDFSNATSNPVSKNSKISQFFPDNA